MGKLLEYVSRGISRISWVSEILAEIVACALAGIVIWGVILTYVFEVSDIFSVEVSEYLLVFLCFASIAWILKEGRHVRVEVIVGRLSPKTQVIMDLVVSLMALLFCVVLVWKAAGVTVLNFQRGFRSASLVNFPLWIPYLIITLGSLLLTLQYIVQIRGIVVALKHPPESPEPGERKGAE
jgi:TRAP-type C4-dicarboxylate transport system permease small subunit